MNLLILRIFFSGEWIKLKDSEWALAVESCLKSLIHAFCVNDHDDSLQLEKIFKEVCPEIKPPLFIISQFQVCHCNFYPGIFLIY